MAPYYVESISVSYADSPPEDCIKELHTSSPNINQGFGGKYVWLIPKRTDDFKAAATFIQIQIYETATAASGRLDLAGGAGGEYRYLKLFQDTNENSKITRVALYRKGRNEGRVTIDEALKYGFNRVSTDINEGRGGDYLHFIYQVTY